MKHVDINNLTEEQMLQYATFSWRDGIHVVLDKMDEALKLHGLEIEGVITGGDFYMYRIVKK